jgi:hypothetical protein
LKFEKFKFSEHSLEGRPQHWEGGGGQVTLKYLIISLKKKNCKKREKIEAETAGKRREGAATFSTKALGIMTFSIMKLSIMTL